MDSQTGTSSRTELSSQQSNAKSTIKETTDVEKSKTGFKSKIPILKNVSIVVLAILAFALVIVVVVIAQKSPPEIILPEPEKLVQEATETQSRKTPKESVCTKAVCAKAAAILHSYINPMVDPCDDFFDHACGNFNDNTGLSQPGHGLTKSMENVWENRFRSIFEKESIPTKSGKLLKVLYEQCVEAHENMSSENPTAPLSVLNEIAKVGKWPILDKTWTESDFNLTQLLINYSKIVLEDFGFFKIDLNILKSTSEIRIYLHSFDPTKTIHKTSKNNDQKSSKDLKNWLLQTYDDILNDLGLEIDEEDDDDENEKYYFEDAVDLQIRIINQLQNESNKTMRTLNNIEELKSVIPSIDWKVLIDHIIGSDGKSNRKVTFILDKFVENSLPEIFAGTSPKILTDFLFLQLLGNTLKFIRPGGVSTDNNLPDIGYIRNMCVRMIKDLFPLSYVMNAAFEHIELEDIDGVSKMTEKLKSTFEKIIKQNNWLDDGSKNSAIQKVEKMSITIAYPDKYRDVKKFDELFEKLNFDKTTPYFENVIRTLKWRSTSIRDSIANNEPLQLDFGKVNAHYQPSTNTLVIDFPFVDEPFYNHELVDYFNFGSVGNVIGHEMGHGFDPDGVTWNENMENKNLYSESTMKKFGEVKRCFEDVYSSYKHPRFPNETIDGKISILENIADYIGMTLTYNYVKNDSKDRRILPGFENHERLKVFFYSYASTFCNKFLDDKKFDSKRRAVHGLNRFRVNGVVSNFDGFSEVFNCKKGSKMNPERKCKYF